MDTKKLVFLLPTYNEEKAIGALLTDINNEYPDARIVVVDNNSTDGTQDIVKRHKCMLLTEKQQGKGFTVRTGFRYITENLDSEYIVMLDADYTYDPKDAQALLDSLISSDRDIVIGSRLKGHLQKGSISKFNFIGNRTLTTIARILYKVDVSDMCTGYWAFKRGIIKKLLEYPLMAKGFELEAEMIVKSAAIGLKIGEEPITYRKRMGNPSNLNAIFDGWKIIRLMMLYSPTILFLLPGIVLMLIGFGLVSLLMTGPVFVNNIGLDIHPMILGNLLVIIGFQVLILGFYTKIFVVAHGATKLKGIIKIFFLKNSLTYGLLFGLLLFAIGLVIDLRIILSWITTGFGVIPELRNAIMASTLMCLGIQIVFSIIFISVLLLDSKNLA